MWRKSSRSGNNANCVEVARDSRAVGVRDSKHTSGQPLAFVPASFGGFLAELKTGRFDR